MMRKLIFTVLALILATALFGCGEGGFSSSFTLPRQGEETARGTDAQTETETETAAEVEWSYSLKTDTVEREYD